jgi:hypothetical protein
MNLMGRSLTWHRATARLRELADHMNMKPLSSIRERARRSLVWLLAPVLVLASSGARICWCHGGGGGHPHGSEVGHSLVDAQHDHDGRSAEFDGNSSPNHDHGLPDGGCWCVGSDTSAVEVAKGAIHEGDGGANATMGWVTPPVREIVYPRIALLSAWTVRAHAPPLFVLNCAYRC